MATLTEMEKIDRDLLESIVINLAEPTAALQVLNRGTACQSNEDNQGEHPTKPSRQSPSNLVECRP